MNILIINQHTWNHGDEAAGNALLRSLRNFNIDKIDILYNTVDLTDTGKLKAAPEAVHYCSRKMSFMDKILIILTFVLPFDFIRKFYCLGFSTKYEYQLINKYDKVISAPGGVNIGPYKDWRYLWRLYIAEKLNKDVGIYSISFGPIPEIYLFKKISKFVLSNAKFLSLRDLASYQYAERLGLNYIKSIDTAFLDSQPITDLPSEISAIVEKLKGEYVVVPNQLNKWHPNFKNVDAQVFEDIFLKIISYFLAKNLNVILLPQLFGFANDSNYFEELKNKISDKRGKVIVVRDDYSSDIQQKIISNARFVVGARYHSIIFAINNKCPFLSLSYEHKMDGTLESLGLEKCNVRIKDIINREIDVIGKLDKVYSNREALINDINKARIKARGIAKETLRLLWNDFLSKSKNNDVINNKERI